MGRAGPYGDLVAQERDGAPRYHHFDALGSTRALSDALQVVTDEYAYGAWGEPLTATGSSPNPYRWVGELGYRYDATNATYNLRAREYQDKIARFLSRDPIREENEEPNRYRYADGSPADVADPAGEQPPTITYDPRTDTWSPPVTVVIVIGNQVEVIIDGQHYIYQYDSTQLTGRRGYSDPRPGSFPPAVVRRHRDDQRSVLNELLIDLLVGAAFGLAGRAFGRGLGGLRKVRPGNAGKPRPAPGPLTNRAGDAEAAAKKARTDPTRGLAKPDAPPPPLPRPPASDPKLRNLVEDLYKGTKHPYPKGTGSTADALRFETETGLRVGGRFHKDKAKQYISALQNWLRKHPNASEQDKLIAQSLLDDLKAALAGN